MGKIENKQNLMKKSLTFLSSPAFLGTFLCALILGFLLFGPHALGYGDNGSFQRVLISNGLYPLNGQNYTGFFNVDYGLRDYFDENIPIFWSSQTIFIKLAILLNKLFFSSRFFDIHFLGFIYYVAYLGAIAMLLMALTRAIRSVKNYLFMILVVFVLGDASYGLYLNSMYPDTVTLIASLYMFASFLMLLRSTLKYRYIYEIFYFVNIILLLTAKEQNFLLLGGILILSIGLISSTKNKQKKLLFSLILVLSIFLGGLGFTTNIKNEQNILKYGAVTKGVLQSDTNRSKTLSKADISPQYVLMADEDYYPTTYVSLAPNSKQVKQGFIKKINYRWITWHYVTNPKYMYQLLNVAASDLMQTRIKGVGNYTKSQGKLRQQTKYTALFSFWFERIYPAKYAFNLMLAVTLLIIYAVGYYNDRKRGSAVGGLKLALVIGMLLNVLILPIGLIILQGDMSLAQNLLPAALSMQLLLLLLLSDGLNDTLWHAQKDQK